MVDLKEYRHYWQQYLVRIPAIKEVVPMTVEQDISRKVQDVKTGELVLFIIVPEAAATGRNVDDMEDRNEAVVLLAKKYDPQRGGSYPCIEEVQPYIEALREWMFQDMAQSCPVLGRVDLDSIRLMPVSTWYNVLAGWMMDFTFRS